MARIYKRGDVFYCWGYDAHGARWRESTKQHDRKAAEIVGREIARRRALESAEAPAIGLREALVMVGDADERAGRSAAVRQILEQKGRQLVAYFGAEQNIRKLTRTGLEAYADHRIKSVSRHTAAKELWVLRRALRVSGVGWSDAMMPDLGRLYVPRDRWLPMAEFRALWEKLAPPRRDYLEAFVYTGARRSELYSLTGSDVDGTRLRIRGTKTVAAHRWVPIAEPIRAMLGRRSASSPMFPEWQTDNRDLALACEKAKIAPVTPNDLRRTFASWLANAGVSPLVTARLMGHTSTRMVERVYARLGVEIQADAVARLPVYNSEPGFLEKAEVLDTADNDRSGESP